MVKNQEEALFGTLVKRLLIKPCHYQSVAQAIELGKYGKVHIHGDVARIFADEEVSLDKHVSVDLIRYNRDWSYKEMVAWAKDNGDRKPILAKHLFSIGIQYPEEQRQASILAFGSIRRDVVLYLRGDSNQRQLGRISINGHWVQDCLVGFLREQFPNT